MSIVISNLSLLENERGAVGDEVSDLKRKIRMSEAIPNQGYSFFIHTSNGKSRIDNSVREHSIRTNGGPIDAAYKVIRQALGERYPETSQLDLEDYSVGIANRHSEESSVRTLIRFRNKEAFETVGVDSNVIASGVQAISKGFDYYLQKQHSQVIKSEEAK